MLSALLLVSPCALAQDGANPNTQTAESSSILQTSKKANLRELPNRRSTLLAELGKAARVEVIDRLNDGENIWAYVRVTDSGQQGYLLWELLEPLPTPTPIPTPTPVPTPSPTPKPTATPKPTPTPTPEPPQELVYDEPVLARTNLRVNLRKTPGGKRLAELPAGTRLSVIGEIELEDGLWMHVTSEDGREGYVSSEFVRQLRPVVLLPVSEEEVRALFPVISCDPLADLKKAIPFTYTEEELAQYHTLSEGDRSNDVLALKRKLYEKGYYTKPNENLLYTASTAEVVGFFQEDSGLPVTGIADPQTQAQLFDDRTPAREGSPQEVLYLDNKRDAPLYIQNADVSSLNYYGSVQLAVENRTGGKLTRFGIRAIPYMLDGTAADMADTFAEEIEREYSITGLNVANGGTYSDFYSGYVIEHESSDYDEFWEELFPDLDFGSSSEPTVVPDHHFQISYKTYFSGAQVAISWYCTDGRNVYVDDDQLIFISVGKGVNESLIHTLPIEITDEETANAGWEMGIVTRYVLPVYQSHYDLPQGAWIKSVEPNSPAEDAGLMPGDIIAGINDITILGDATLRKARGSIAPGETATLYFWRDGQYYTTELIRPEEDAQ